jgi:hypothetical protein
MIDQAAAQTDEAVATSHGEGWRGRWRALPLEMHVLSALLLVEFVLLALNGLNTFTFHTDFLILEEEGNLPTWASSIFFAFASALCVLAGLARGNWVAWGPLATLAGLFSLEEIASLHDDFEASVGDAAVVEIASPLVAVLLLGVAWLVVRDLKGLTRALVIAAGLALVIAQLVSAGNSALEPPYNVHVIMSMSEELSEMLVGALLIAAATPLALTALGRISEAAAERGR